MSDKNHQKSSGRGAPTKPDGQKLQPRFTLNMTDQQNEIFEKAVNIVSVKRSAFARNALLDAAKKVLLSTKTK